MLKFNIPPDHFTISTLCRGIKGNEHKASFERVIDLFYSHKPTIEECTTVMYNCLIECCILTNNMNRGLKLFQEFKAEENNTEKPDLVT